MQSVEPTNSRTWFMDQDVVAGEQRTTTDRFENYWHSSDGKLLLMTPIDPAFLLIPILQSVRPVRHSMASFILSLKHCALDRWHPGKFQTSGRYIWRCRTKIRKRVPGDRHYRERPIVACITKGCPSVRFSGLHTTRLEAHLRCQRYYRSWSLWTISFRIITEVTPEIVVYRYSSTKIVDYLRAKVARLATPQVFEGSRTLIRGLAKDGLMEDGKENLLEGKEDDSALDIPL